MKGMMVYLVEKFYTGEWVTVCRFRAVAESFILENQSKLGRMHIVETELRTEP